MIKMIDFGIYEIRKEANKYIVIEKLEGQLKEFDSLENVIDFISTSLREVESQL